MFCLNCGEKIKQEYEFCTNCGEKVFITSSHWTGILTPNTSLDEPLEKKELEKSVSEKEKLLVDLLQEIEQLKIDLSITKQEYDVKIGRLYLRLDEVNLEILKFKKIEDLLDQGLSFLEARKIVEESLKSHYEQIRDEYEKLKEEENALKNQKELNEKERQELKKLYHKLAHKFHPDLTGGNDLMMKKINKAYAEGDIDTLRAIDRENLSDETAKTTSIEELKNKLQALEKLILKTGSEYEILKKSEWFILKENIENAKTQKRDLLNELSDKILTDIAKQENHLKEFNKKYGQRE